MRLSQRPGRVELRGGRETELARILLVEDNDDVRVLLEHVLYDAKHRVDAVATAAEAQSLIEARRYDLVVADGLLCDGTGMQIADEARARGMRALIITGYAFRISAELLGYDYLLKPVRPAELLAAIEARLGGA